MVFTFEHVSLDTMPGGTKWDLAPLSLPALKQNLAQSQNALADYYAATGASVDQATVLHSLGARSRDNARTLMQCDASTQAGFTTGTPRMPVNPNHTIINAAAQRNDPASMFHHFRALIALRHENALVREGRFELLLPDHEQFTRTLDDKQLLVIPNCSSTPAVVPFAIWTLAERGELLLSTHPEDVGAPWESRIVSLRDMTARRARKAALRSALTPVNQAHSPSQAARIPPVVLVCYVAPRAG